MSTTNKETLSFQTEVKQLLHLMINAMYSNKEIFLRELISNSADAVDKLRFLSLSDSRLLADDTELTVRIDFDKKKSTITIADNGIGMSRDEVISHLGTIAKSGTKEFLQSLSGEQAKDAKLIGQFGVGFYSAFMVADKVTVETRRADLTAVDAVRWESTADGDYTLETITKTSRGTDIILHLKKSEKEFLDETRLQHIIKKYSDHINLPIVMKLTKHEVDKSATVADGDTPPLHEVSTDSVINAAKALWTTPKAEIKADEYNAFYKHLSHDFMDPLAWTHNTVEGKLDYTLLLYLSARAPFDLYEPEGKHGLKLYIKCVFIMDDAEQFLPRYLRFVKGVVDCKDLPLNVSRELLQHSPIVDKIRAACVKRSLDMLEKLAQDADKFAVFWRQFGNVLKEGLVEDKENSQRIAKLLRFSSTHDAIETQTVSLADYIARMKIGQEKIYYLTAESWSATTQSPHLELFRDKAVEVLLLSDRVDEWWVSHLPEFAGKKLQSVAKGDLDVSALGDAASKPALEQSDTEFTEVIERIKAALKTQVSEVRLTHRLISSPACVVVNEHEMTLQMQRLLQQAGHAVPMSKPIFEINPQHEIIKNLTKLTDATQFSDWSEVLLAEAILIEGGKLDNPAAFVQRINKLFTYTHQAGDTPK